MMQQPPDERGTALTSEENADVRQLLRSMRSNGWAGDPIMRGLLPQFPTVAALPTIVGNEWAYRCVTLEGLPDITYQCLRTAGGAWTWTEIDNAAVTASIAAHLADAADAHDASAVSILDSAADFTATDVEGALAELQSDNETHTANVNGHHNQNHNTRHDAGGADPMTVQNQSSGAAALGTVPTANGSGGFTMTAVTRAIWVPVVYATNAGTSTPPSAVGNHQLVSIGSATEDGVAYFSVGIPTGFTTLSKAVLVCYSSDTANLRYSVATSWGADGEARTANSDSITTTTRAMTADELDAIDVSAAFTGVAAGDYAGLAFSRLGTDALDTITGFRVLGLLLEYT